MVGTVPFPEVDDAIECVRGRPIFEEIPEPERGGWLPEPALVDNSRVLTRDIVRFLTRCSANS
jgi:hypothetical protein